MDKYNNSVGKSICCITILLGEQPFCGLWCSLCHKGKFFSKTR